ncbi:MAG: NAD(P)/FAD-dependent oxidoreductase, partial [Chloroflexota bacterium]|nr:NAD(P)/FAD-dependent oxidoreductase [Chloroflexota bacterium]
ELDRAGRVPVNPDLSIPGHPEIFVIGDLASIMKRDGQPIPGIAPAAIQGGKWAAANIQRVIAGQPSRPFRYRDLGNMAVIARNEAVVHARGIKLTGFVAWLAWAIVHVINLIGYRSRIQVTTQWLWSYVTSQRGARLITGEQSRETRER